MIDMYENGITEETVTNPNVINSAIGVLQKLFNLHPYMFCFFDIFSLINLSQKYPLDSIPRLESLINGLTHIITLIIECRKVIDFTFSPKEICPELEQFDIMTRYYIYTEYLMDPRSVYTNLPQRNFEFIHSSFPASIPVGSNIQKIVKAFSNTKTVFESISHLDIYNDSNTCTEAIITIIQKEKMVQKCKLCNNYYFSKGKYRSIYCNNFYKNSGRTCQQVAASNNHKNKKNSNPILREYERAYKRNYARVSTHRLSNEEFRLWVEKASQKRDKVSAEYEANPSEHILVDFKKYLGNK